MEVPLGELPDQAEEWQQTVSEMADGGRGRAQLRARAGGARRRGDRTLSERDQRRRASPPSSSGTCAGAGRGRAAGPPDLPDRGRPGRPGRPPALPPWARRRRRVRGRVPRAVRRRGHRGHAARARRRLRRVRAGRDRDDHRVPGAVRGADAVLRHARRALGAAPQRRSAPTSCRSPGRCCARWRARSRCCSPAGACRAWRTRSPRRCCSPRSRRRPRAPRLGRALGLFAALQAAGQTSAPLLGGLAAEVSWRLAFVGVAVAAAALAVDRAAALGGGNGARTGPAARGVATGGAARGGGGAGRLGVPRRPDVPGGVPDRRRVRAERGRARAAADRVRRGRHAHRPPGRRADRRDRRPHGRARRRGRGAVLVACRRRAVAAGTGPAVGARRVLRAVPPGRCERAVLRRRGRTRPARCRWCRRSGSSARRWPRSRSRRSTTPRRRPASCCAALLLAVLAPLLMPRDRAPA